MDGSISRWQARPTQQALATAAGTLHSTIAAYESGATSATLRTVPNPARATGTLQCAS
jgi:transcriptional regulator with XRE-family HTH domain